MEQIILPESWREWEIIEKVGSGAFGTVYKARKIVGKQEFFSAIKIIHVPPDASELDEMRRQMGDEQSVRAYFSDLVDGYIREINTMDELKGTSNIVSVEDYCVIEDTDVIGWTIYIRMEYLQSFAKYASVTNITEEEVIKLGIDICSALECCEKLHIVHRDIKPDNIFIAPLGQYKLGDFGEARHLDRTIYSYSSRGTYGYMAPEVYYGKEYGLQADIYSLGIVLYRLMNQNRDPFINPFKQLITYSEREDAMHRRMTGEQIPPPEMASEQFARVILKACAYAPNERYRNAAEMKQDLLDLQKKGGRTGSRENAKRELKSGRRAHKAAIITVIIIVLCFLAIALFLLWRSHNHREEGNAGALQTGLETEKITAAERISENMLESEYETKGVSGKETELNERETETELFLAETELTETAAESKETETEQTETETEPAHSKDVPVSVLSIQYEAQTEMTVIDISGCASFDFGEADGKAHKYLNKKKVREILNENAPETLSEAEMEKIVSLMSLDAFTLDQTEDFQTGDVVTMSFTPDEELQNLMDEMGLELKFSEIRKEF